MSTDSFWNSLMGDSGKIISRKLKGYLFEDSIREFNPEKLYKTKESRKRESYKVHGVNILNRDDLDSKTAIERRDMINNAIEELSEIIPNAQQDRFARRIYKPKQITYVKRMQLSKPHDL
ncbi:hypothetical protein K493DRAFT_356410 [Basidiobolus meristosporus CBS 931.73]|uniref:Uncharacterized protein n=1 Tax=Basidiobolus meristosporus CBS 931.73 TaxID=1314790 RepID=A0A1Y1XYN4_9FUNG|nr:hypothetical protein K493DRAFT_356410 [Basidiobolus meristosporus CBS 931.73]|eukprot:ORX90765.1 hypothetical protein K493DRAFT_356410 [Basidiobolus meristosporus CBS 931.73]